VWDSHPFTRERGQAEGANLFLFTWLTFTAVCYPLPSPAGDKGKEVTDFSFKSFQGRGGVTRTPVTLSTAFFSVPLAAHHTCPRNRTVFQRRIL
jgi:hypothetical protein